MGGNVTNAALGVFQNQAYGVANGKGTLGVYTDDKYAYKATANPNNPNAATIQVFQLTPDGKVNLHGDQNTSIPVIKKDTEDLWTAQTTGIKPFVVGAQNALKELTTGVDVETTEAMPEGAEKTAAEAKLAGTQMQYKLSDYEQKAMDEAYKVASTPKPEPKYADQATLDAINNAIMQEQEAKK